MWITATKNRFHGMKTGNKLRRDIPAKSKGLASVKSPKNTGITSAAERGKERWWKQIPKSLHDWEQVKQFLDTPIKTTQETEADEGNQTIESQTAAKRVRERAIPPFQRGMTSTERKTLRPWRSSEKLADDRVQPASEGVNAHENWKTCWKNHRPMHQSLTLSPSRSSELMQKLSHFVRKRQTVATVTIDLHDEIERLRRKRIHNLVSGLAQRGLKSLIGGLPADRQCNAEGSTVDADLSSSNYAMSDLTSSTIRTEERLLPSTRNAAQNVGTPVKAAERLDISDTYSGAKVSTCHQSPSGKNERRSDGLLDFCRKFTAVGSIRKYAILGQIEGEYTHWSKAFVLQK
jgi:hypothetical protein